MPTLPSLLSLGFILGLKHALDADHLAAVATIVGKGSGVLRASRIGLLWGLGHTAALLVISAALIAFQVRIPEQFAAILELVVAAMLAWLAISLIRQAVKSRGIHLHPHRHGDIIHAHPHTHEAAHRHEAPLECGWARARPFLIGLVHGAAGSAAVMLLVVASVPEPATALLFVLVFGIGSVGGMLITSAALSLPLAAAARGSARLFRAAQAVVAGLTLFVSARIVWDYFQSL